MSVIGGPEILRVCHQCCKIAFDAGQIELFEFSSVVEVRRHGIGSIVVLVKDLKADPFGPPIHTGGTITGMQIGALGCCTHGLFFNDFSSWMKISPRFDFMGFAVFRHDFFLVHFVFVFPF